MKTADATKTLKVWSKKHRLTLAVAGLSAIYCVVIYAIPPLVCCFAWQRLLGAIGYLIQGVLLFLYPLLPELHLSPLLSKVFFSMLAILWGMGASLLTEYLWSLGRVARVVVIVAVTLNVCAGLFVIFWADVIVGPAYAKCEHLYSNTRGVRIVAYPEYGALPGGHFFFFSTSDGGQTWKQFEYFRHDDPFEPQCENIEFVDDKILLKWSSYSRINFVSLDEGKTWQRGISAGFGR
jgi:hypothetical protein